MWSDIRSERNRAELVALATVVSRHAAEGREIAAIEGSGIPGSKIETRSSSVEL
jgi:hypothetical protein